MKIVFFGSGAFGLPTLEALCPNHELLAVVTQPDRPAGRKRRLTPTPIGGWAAEHLTGIPLIKPENVNEPTILEQVRAFNADAWVIIAFGQKLSEPLLANKFAINLHASLLPRWRGAAPINHAILAGDTQTGNSVITLADKMDAGLVLGQSHRTIEPDQTKDDLHNLLAADGPALIGRVLQQHKSGALEPVVQDESLVTLAGKLTKDDGAIDWNASAHEIACRINGLSPWPSVRVPFRGEPLKLLRAVAAPSVDRQEQPGAVLDPGSGLVATGAGVLRIIDVQPSSKKPMGWASFHNGHNVLAGESFNDS